MADRSQRWAPQQRARRRALQALYQWQITGQDTSEIVVQFNETQDFEGVDHELFKTLVFGTAREAAELREWLEPAMHRPWDQCEVIERVALLLGAWQLRNDPNLPTEVILDESTDLAKRFGSENGHAYVNAVLNRLAKPDAGAS